MNNHTAMIEFIKSISGQANVLTIPRPYIEFMGSLDGGLFLSQLLYWSDKGQQGDGWFYKTYAEWEAELTLSKYEVSKQIKILKEKGILETKIKKANGAPTVHYHFLFDEFQKSIVKFLHYRKSKNLTNESQKTSQSITEITTEITTEDNPVADATGDDFIFLLGNVETVKAHLEDSSTEFLQMALDKERGGKNRAGVVRFIEDRLKSDNPIVQPWGDMFKGLADCCEYDTCIISAKERGQLGNAARTMLANGYTLGDIEGFRQWWDKETFLGRKGQPPKLYNLREEWGRFRKSQKNGNGHTSPPLTDEQLKEYNRLVSEMKQTQKGYS